MYNSGMQAEATYAEPETKAKRFRRDERYSRHPHYEAFFTSDGDFKDFYGALGLDRSASKDDIKKEFRKLAKEYHPDRNPGDKIAEAIFKILSDANDTLKDDEKRARYDGLYDMLLVTETAPELQPELDDVSDLPDDVIFGFAPDPMDPRTNGPNVYTRDYEYSPYSGIKDPANPPSWFTGLLAGRFGYNAAQGVKAPWPEVANIATIHAFVDACGYVTNDLRGATREILKLLEAIGDELLVHEVARMAINDFIKYPHQRGMDDLFLELAKRDPNLVQLQDITNLLANNPEDRGNAEDFHTRKNAKAKLATALLKNDPRLVAQSQFAIKNAMFTAPTVSGHRKLFMTFFDRLNFNTHDVGYLNKRIQKNPGTAATEQLSAVLRKIYASQPELKRDYLHQVQSARPGFAL